MKKLLKDNQDADKVVSYIRDGTEDTKLKENISMVLYQKIQSPITTKLEKLEHKMEDVNIPFMYDRMLNQNQLAIEDPYYYQNQLEIEDPYYDQPQPIEEAKQKTFTVDIFKGIDKEVISKYNIPTKYNSKDEIDDVLENIIIPKFKDNTKKLKSITNENKRFDKEGKN